ncbi:MAG: NTP transferase domain-containing protein, partial [Acidimicrobiia bacterium]|nr:NTP transferase domain-containing protein [Acidimicrobiia bacterium]
MGRTKALVEIEGIPMARRVADALRRGGCEHVVVVGGDARELRPLGLTVVADLFPGKGPLGGVLTALEFSARPVLGRPGTARPGVVALDQVLDLREEHRRQIDRDVDRGVLGQDRDHV